PRHLVFASFPRVAIIPTLQEFRTRVKFRVRGRVPVRGRFVHRQRGSISAMVQGYYTLQEAAEVLGMGLDDLKGLAQKNQIRSFQDRGPPRFRIQDIQELQRQRIGNSDPEMVLGDAVSPKPLVAPAPKSGNVKTPRPKSGAKGADVFDFQLDD